MYSSIIPDYQPVQGRVEQSNAFNTFSPRPPLGQWVHCFWQLDIPPGKFSYRSVPDNCVDWIVNVLNPEENVVITPYLEPQTFPLAGPVSYFGIRFRILAYQGLFSLPVGEIESACQARDLFSTPYLNEMLDEIFMNLTFHRRCEALTETLLGALVMPKVDHRLAKFVRYCYRCFYDERAVASPALSDKQCSEFGLSSRQLRRLSHLYLGLGPKHFARVLRFQSALAQLSRSTARRSVVPYSTDSANLHYFDQAHFIREFKSLAGMTPREFQRLSVLYNS